MNFVYLKVLFVDPKNLPFPFCITNHEKKNENVLEFRQQICL